MVAKDVSKLMKQTCPFCSNDCVRIGGVPVGGCAGCAKDSDCSSDGSKYCDSIIRQCLPIRSRGVPCVKDLECGTGHCHLGICTDGCNSDADCVNCKPPLSLTTQAALHLAILVQMLDDDTIEPH